MARTTAKEPTSRSAGSATIWIGTGFELGRANRVSPSAKLSLAESGTQTEASVTGRVIDATSVGDASVGDASLARFTDRGAAGDDTRLVDGGQMSSMVASEGRVAFTPANDQIVTWNDWNEGTQIEPTLAGGTDLLAALITERVLASRPQIGGYEPEGWLGGPGWRSHCAGRGGAPSPLPF